jgi:hypothetical protein
MGDWDIISDWDIGDCDMGDWDMGDRDMGDRDMGGRDMSDRDMGDRDIISELNNETITCYTDGSKTEEGTGYGSTTTTNNNNIELNTQSSKLPDYCTVYQAELTAITNAASALKL